MMTRGITVVGGGITGCVTALRLAQAGHRVTLVEAKPALGGTLRDFVANDIGFLRGCQYIEPRAPWLSQVAELAAQHLVVVPHNMGSHTVQHGEARERDAMAMPVLRGALPDAATRNTPVHTVTLAERFAHYGAWAEPLTAYAERTGYAATQLSSDAAIALQMMRVLPADVPEAEVLTAKSQWPWADAHLAVPRAARGVGEPTALVPRAGWNAFFAALHQLLESRGVVVRTGCKVKAVRQDGALRVMCDDASQNDMVVWAANPIPLAPLFGLGTLDNAAVAATNIHAQVTSWGGATPLYVQWFEAASALMRVYVYRWGDEQRVCFECYGSLNADAAAQVAASGAEAMRSWGGALALAALHVDVHRRHHLLTVSDHARLSVLEETLSNAGAVGGAWTEYGREQKLAAIAERLVRLGLLSAGAMD